MKSLTGWEKSKELAAFLGISGSSVSGTKGRGNFPLEWARKIAKEYNVSIDWILEGKGLEPSTVGSTGKNPNDQVEIKHGTVGINDAFDALGVVEGMGLLTEIYSSGDIVYIRAINANLMAFSDAVKTKVKAVALSDTIHQIQDQMIQMREQINELNTKVLGLHNENSELKSELRSKRANDPEAASG